MIFKDNPDLNSLFEKGRFIKDYEFNDSSLELKQSIVDYLNMKLPTMWSHDPFNGTVSIDGFHDAAIIEYDDHKEFQVDSDKYRICVCMIMVGDEASLDDF